MKLKKFFSLLLVAALFVGFTSCSDDDDNDIPGAVLGSWKYSTLEPIVESDNALITAAAKEYILPTFEDIDIDNFTLTFKEGGVCTYSVSGQADENGTYSYTNGKLTVSGLEILNMGGPMGSVVFDVTSKNGNLLLELDMKPLLNGMVELEDLIGLLTKVAVIITLTPVS